MRAPISWLKDWVEIDLSVEELAEKLLLSGTKVETIENGNGESVLVLEITSNRPDCLSLYGIAREIAALTNKPLKHLEFPLPKLGNTHKNLKITVSDPKLCPIYTSLIIDNVSIKPSPDWMAKRLASVGVRPINNIVDISNYVMFEYGIPMHTFDYDQLLGHEVTIRGSREGERVTPLDGQERILQAGSIIIEDTRRLVDLAGIMGGQNSEISGKTKTVFLHVPLYDPIAIRKTSKYLGLRTEAVTRYEKKLDLLGTEYSMQRAVNLILEISGGDVASDVYFFDTVHYKSPTITLTESDIKTHIGISIPIDKVEKLLRPLEFKTNKLIVEPPTFRRDITIKEDIIEEIARMYGYNNLPLTLPQGDIPIHPDAFEKDWTREVKTLMTGLGFTECYGNTLTSGELLQNADFDTLTLLKVLHPMSIDFEYFRPSLIPGLLTMVKENLYHTNAVSLFEIGTIFPGGKGEQKKVSENKLPDQPESLAAITTTGNFQTLKGFVEILLSHLHIQAKIVPAQKDVPAYYASAEVAQIEGLGWIGRVGNDVTIYAFELDIVALAQKAKKDFHYPQLPKYPPIIEDLSFVIPAKTHIGFLVEKMHEVSHLVKKVELLDQYKDTYTLRLYYQSPEKTLTTEEVEKIREKIISSVEKTFRARIKR